MVPLSDVTKQTVKEKHNPEKSRDYYNVQPYLYRQVENQQGVGIYVDDSHVTHGILFPGVNVFKDETHEVSIFQHKIAEYLNPESELSIKDKETLKPVFKAILEELDFGKDREGPNSPFEAGRLKHLLLDVTEQRRLTGIMVKHKSEWAKSQASKFDELIALARRLNDNEAADRIQTRVVDLGIGLRGEGFDSEREAYYFHPLGMIGWLNTDKIDKRCFCCEQGLMSSPCSEGAPVLEQHYEALSKELGVEKEVLKAAAEVESKGKGFISLNGEQRAKILYERHYMYKN
ncbi:N-acetylmuramidase domain-containing protein [Aggregatibacter actinomycetemcomitans]|uniref:N-acetylmuramidase domain-containing protein n=1 Tax=Aggregatibacter actinomycetemcomitans TaxID=714 RepID=UPI0021CC73C7|nr:N-acetylmuramidase domain-containing protein [Aggregatibacter actinomycetemcomitans]